MAVGRMRRAAQRVDNPDIKVLELIPRRIGNCGNVGHIGHVADPKPKRVDIAMLNLNRGKGNRAARTVDSHIACDAVQFADRGIG